MQKKKKPKKQKKKQNTATFNKIFSIIFFKTTFIYLGIIALLEMHT